jgi:hypothetical protein
MGLDGDKAGFTCIPANQLNDTVELLGMVLLVSCWAADGVGIDLFSFCFSPLYSLRSKKCP